MAPTQKRANRNRRAILAAAEALFGTRGVEGVSIDEVAAEAALAKGTVYNHFADKDALAREIAASARADGEARVAAANRDVSDPVRRVVRAMLVFARLALDRPERARALLRLAPRATDPRAAVNAGLRADLQAGIDTGRFTVSADAGAAGVIGLATMLVARICDGAGDAAAVQAFAVEVSAIAMRGLGVAPDEAAQVADAEAQDIFTAGERPADNAPAGALNPLAISQNGWEKS